MSHLKTLIKKISSNLIVKEAFQDFLVAENVIDKEALKQHEFITDYLLLNILD
jgi:hypothetical protein